MRDAITKANDAGLDLVEIVPNAKPPVCKLIDYNKFLYEQNHKEVKPHKTVVKEAKFRAGVGEHDYKVSINKIANWLDKEYKVKIAVVIKGRRAGNSEVARALSDKIREDLGKKYKLNYTTSQNGTWLLTMIEGAEALEVT